MDPAQYVLRPFGGGDAITAQIVIERAADAVESWLTDGIELAMTRHNGSVGHNGSVEPEN
jgi:peptidyl-tRNA hydrolase